MFRIMIISVVAIIGLAGCGDDASQKVSHEKNTATNIKPVAVKNETNTQDVKKNDAQPAVVQGDIEQVSQETVASLAGVKEKVKAPSVKPVTNPCAVKATDVVANPCSVDTVAKNPCAVKPVAVVNPCNIKAPAVVKKAAVVKKPTIVKVATNFTGKCKACHKVSKDAVGPSFKKIQAAYASSEELAKVFEAGFVAADRKVAASEAKYKKKIGMMTSQYKKLIKKKVEAGKFTYQALADEIFSK